MVIYKIIVHNNNYLVNVDIYINLNYKYWLKVGYLLFIGEMSKLKLSLGFPSSG